MLGGCVKLGKAPTYLGPRIPIHRHTRVAGMGYDCIDEPLNPFALSRSVSMVILDDNNIGSIPDHQLLDFPQFDIVFRLSRRLFHTPVNQYPWPVKNGKADASRVHKERKYPLRPNWCLVHIFRWGAFRFRDLIAFTAASFLGAVASEGFFFSRLKSWCARL